MNTFMPYIAIVLGVYGVMAILLRLLRQERLWILLRRAVQHPTPERPGLVKRLLSVLLPVAELREVKAHPFIDWLNTEASEHLTKEEMERLRGLLEKAYPLGSSRRSGAGGQRDGTKTHSNPLPDALVLSVGEAILRGLGLAVRPTRATPWKRLPHECKVLGEAILLGAAVAAFAFSIQALSGIQVGLQLVGASGGVVIGRVLMFFSKD